MKPLAMSCVVLGLVLTPGPANALMTPLSDGRFTSAIVEMLGMRQDLEEHPSAPFAFFNSFLDAVVENPDPEGTGYCQATAFQNSQFHPTLAQASGTAGGYIQGASGLYSAASISGFRFRLDSCVQYTLDVWIEPGTVPEACQFLLVSHPSYLRYHDVQAGELHVTGRLSPGDYLIEGRSSFTTGDESFEGGTYAYVFQVFPCAGTLIAGHPVGVAVPCGTDAQFTVTPQGGAGALTYQWRRNGVPLANSSHISGATSAQLTVHAPCHPDSGYYDVLVSDGTNTEPSQPAKLTVTATSGVGPGLAVAAPMQIALAGPSPFLTQTTFRYSSPGAQPATIAIYDISGARIRTLAERVTSTMGVVAWDGRTHDGARAPAGIYYARIESAAASGACRVVKLN